MRRLASRRLSLVLAAHLEAFHRLLPRAARQEVRRLLLVPSVPRGARLVLLAPAAHREARRRLPQAVHRQGGCQRMLPHLQTALPPLNLPLPNLLMIPCLWPHLPV